MMNTLMHSRTRLPHPTRQRGVVLFFTLIALVVMSLAAVALIRSVDTSGMIAGNMAFKQSTMSSADVGTEAAITWLFNTQTVNSGVNVLVDGTHPFNVTNAALGYYSNFDRDLNLTDGTGIKWDSTDSALVGTDAAGNTTRYVVQRMCRLANTVVPDAGCLFSDPTDPGKQRNVQLPQDVCNGPGCPPPGSTPILRITVQSSGPKNSVSYTQAFVY